MPSRSIPAGNYNRRLDIYNPVVTRGTSGSEVVSQKCIAKSVPCIAKAMKGRESYDEAADRILVVEGYTFTIRYRTDVTAATTIKFEGRSFDVATVSEIGRREALQVSAIVVE